MRKNTVRWCDGATVRRLLRDERGMSFIFVGLGFMAFLAATTLAIDVGMFMTARSQAQNAADAGALAGATALALDSFDDRTVTGPAVQSAVNTDTALNEVHTTMNPSPRVFPIPLFDPDYYQSGKVNGRNATLRVANWIGVFVERRTGNNVYGRITPILGVIDNSAGPAPAGTFPVAIRLVL